MKAAEYALARRYFELVNVGYSREEAAAMLGVSPRQARKWERTFFRELKQTVVETAEEARERQAQALEAIIRRLFVQFQEEGNPKVAQVLVQAMRRQASLLGLDQEQRADVLSIPKRVIAAWARARGLDPSYVESVLSELAYGEIGPDSAGSDLALPSAGANGSEAEELLGDSRLPAD